MGNRNSLYFTGAPSIWMVGATKVSDMERRIVLRRSAISVEIRNAILRMLAGFRNREIADPRFNNCEPGRGGQWPFASACELTAKCANNTGRSRADFPCDHSDAWRRTLGRDLKSPIAQNLDTKDALTLDSRLGIYRKTYIKIRKRNLRTKLRRKFPKSAFVEKLITGCKDQ